MVRASSNPHDFGAARPDELLRIATESGLQMTAEPLYGAVRDILHPPAESEHYYVVTLAGPSADVPALRFVFPRLLSDPAAPALRDVLWWLAGDAWAIHQAGGDFAEWASSYGYEIDDAAAQRLFQLHVQMSESLEALLGRGRFEKALAAYAAEVSRTSMASRPWDVRRLGHSNGPTTEAE